ncbi:hypothetical protein Tsubulata_035441 [Turnera subulata]|uniref:Protein EARLY FLOWERING 4 domain-containing protein n=1 Tax=Turnera subulata TaxID=218843 RepID=A0A9Q0IY11_9ROSI|nr:hypothetical protein Tsubulata_035441 [Turnera subulata]
MDHTSKPNPAEPNPITAPSKMKKSEEQGGGGGEAKVWAAFNDRFEQVQTVLDRNRVLINQVNQNHQSRLHDNMVNNVALIQEINGNISKVVSLYSDLNTNFSSMFHQREKNLNNVLGVNDDGDGNNDVCNGKA